MLGRRQIFCRNAMLVRFEPIERKQENIIGLDRLLVRFHGAVYSCNVDRFQPLGGGNPLAAASQHPLSGLPDLSAVEAEHLKFATSRWAPSRTCPSFFSKVMLLCFSLVGLCLRSPRRTHMTYFGNSRNIHCVRPCRISHVAHCRAPWLVFVLVRTLESLIVGG